MAFEDKAALQEQVGAWLNRANDPDLATRFDSFLGLAEANFGSRIRADVIERRLVGTLNERWENQPAGTNQVRSIAILNNGTYQRPALDFLTYQEAVRLYGDSSSGDVQAYALVGQQIGFFPFPQEDLTSTLQFEIIAYVRPDALVLPTDDNEILTEYPGIYLWGTLLESADYYGRSEDKVKWGESYEAEIARANDAAEAKLGDTLVQRVS